MNESVDTSLRDYLDRVVWYAKKKDRDGQVTQWLEQSFYDVWMHTMRENFDLLGMIDRYKTGFVNPNELTPTAHLRGLEKLQPVTGYANRRLLRTMLSQIGEVTTQLSIVRLTGGDVVVVHRGNKKAALDEWKELVELAGQTSVVGIVTPGIRYYVQGTQVGYRPETKHLFRRRNTLELIGKPNEPAWRANVSGFVITIVGSWDEIRKAKRESGLTIFHMLQIRLNEQLEEALKRER